MEKISPKRQLAAMMFTDIVGYTALMGKDSAKALELIRISKEIQKPLVAKHNGKWLKEMGDGAMAQFNTALDAVSCSIEIQETARGKLDAKLRIGIHLGDVTVEKNDVYGDGVNVASRLESIADPGGIYISESIEKAIRGQTNVQAKYLGEVRLKNVDYGVRTYALQGIGLPVPETKEEKELSGHFIAELQRRGVLRAGATYVMLSLFLILLIPYAESMVELPRWSTTALLTILIIGLPIAIYLAWNYERSPEGFVRTSSKESWQNPFSTSQRKPLASNLVIIILLITVFIYAYPRTFSTKTSVNGERVKRFNILFPEDAPLALVGEAENQWSYSSICLSPEGNLLAYIGWRNGRSLLHLRYMDKTEVIPVPGTEGAFGPFFSPDGKWIAFATQTMLKKVMVPDGSPIDIAPVILQSRAVWTKNDDIIFSRGGSIMRVPARGGNLEIIHSGENIDIVGYASGVDITPDQKHILFNDFAGDIYQTTLETEKTILIYPRGGGSPRYLPTGHLIFSRSNALFAVPFDLNTLSPAGRENQVINGIRTELGGPQLTYDNDGLAIHISGNHFQRSAFAWINKSGDNQGIDLKPDNYGSFDLSPDGHLLAVGLLPAQDHIKILDFRTGQLTRVKVPGVERMYSPVWGPDNESIIFGANVDGAWSLFIKNINEVMEAKKLGANVEEWPYSWSESGDFLTVGSTIIRVSAQDEPKVVGELVQGDHMAISPNDDYVVYASVESGQAEIYVQPFPATGEKWQLSIDGGTDPIWSKDGNGIYYHNNLRVYFVEVNSEGSFEHGIPGVYYNGPFMNAVSRSLSLDDKGTLLILEPAGGNQLVREANVTLNWFEEVKRLVPPEKE